MSDIPEKLCKDAQESLEYAHRMIITGNRKSLYGCLMHLWNLLYVYEPRVPLADVPVTVDELNFLLGRCGEQLRAEIATKTGHNAINRLWLFSTYSKASPSLERFGTTHDEFMEWVREYARRYYELVLIRSRTDLAIEILDLPYYHESLLDTILGEGAALYLVQTAIAEIELQCDDRTHAWLKPRYVVSHLRRLRHFLAIRINRLRHHDGNPVHAAPALQLYQLPQLRVFDERLAALLKIWEDKLEQRS